MVESNNCKMNILKFPVNNVNASLLPRHEESKNDTDGFHAQAISDLTCGSLSEERNQYNTQETQNHSAILKLLDLFLV